MAGEKNIEKLNLEKIEKAPHSLEKPVRPETKVEPVSASLEKSLAVPLPIEKKGEGKIIAPFSAQTQQTRRAQAIDNILAEGLNEVFLKMTPAEQKNFKEAGEETVNKINKLLDKAKVKISSIISLLKKWLKLIPHVNKFFLEQEAKIKADKIIRIKNKF